MFQRHLKPASFFQSMMHQKKSLRRVLIVFCLICIQIVAYTCSAIPTVLADSDYDPDSFSVSIDPVGFGDSPAIHTHTLDLSNNGKPSQQDSLRDPIPWSVTVDTTVGTYPSINGLSAPGCQETDWLHISPKQGKVKHKEDAQGNTIPTGRIRVSVEKHNLPPGTECVGVLNFAVPGASTDPVTTIGIDFIVPQKDQDRQ